MAEDFPAKMSRKTVAELRGYIEQRYQYREEAVLAALTELEQRGLPEPNAEALKLELQAGQQQTELREAEVRAEVAEQAQARRVAQGEAPPQSVPTGPALYSPGTIALFSILPLSTMIGGGVLLGLNLVRLRRFRALLLLVVFVLVYLVVMLNLVVLVIARGGVSPIIGYFLFNIPAILVYVRWFWPRYVAAETYRSRSMLPPIIVCFFLSLALQYAMPYLQKQQPQEVQQQMKQLENLLKQ